jgi:hypothetical protein
VQDFDKKMSQWYAKMGKSVGIAYHCGNIWRKNVTVGGMIVL